jgi:hypothetical protein
MTKEWKCQKRVDENRAGEKSEKVLMVYGEHLLGALPFKTGAVKFRRHGTCRVFRRAENNFSGRMHE